MLIDQPHVINYGPQIRQSIGTAARMANSPTNSSHKSISTKIIFI